jgi:hypothetical protein
MRLPKTRKKLESSAERTAEQRQANQGKTPCKNEPDKSLSHLTELGFIVGGLSGERREVVGSGPQDGLNGLIQKAIVGHQPPIRFVGSRLGL